MVRPIRLRGNKRLVSTVIGWNTMRGITLATAKRTVWRVKSQITRSRSLQAVKAAIAVGIAWSVAPYSPGVADDYPYYAPRVPS